MIDLDAYDQLISGLYAAVTDPAHLPGVMIGLRDVFGGSASTLQYRVGKKQRSVSTMPLASADWETNWSWRNPLNMRSLPPASVALDQDIIERRQFTSTEYYNDFLCRFDIPKIMAIIGFADDRQAAMINITRGRHQPEFDDRDLALANRLSTHVATALRSAALLGWRAWSELADTIDQAADAMVVVDDEGAIMHLNPAARLLAEAGDGLRFNGRRLSADRRGDGQVLERAIARAAAGPDPRIGGMVPIQRGSGKRGLIAAVTPLPVDVSVLLGPRPRALITIVDPTRQPRSVEADLATLFGLTRREAEVAQGLARGMTIAEVADLCGITLVTARNYLNRVLRKTEVSRQGELILLLSRLPRRA